MNTYIITVHPHHYAEDTVSFTVKADSIAVIEYMFANVAKIFRISVDVLKDYRVSIEFSDRSVCSCVVSAVSADKATEAEKVAKLVSMYQAEYDVDVTAIWTSGKLDLEF